MPVLLLLLLAGLLFPGQAQAYLQQNNRAVELLRKGQFQQGLVLLKEAQQRQPYDKVVRENLSQAYLVTGRALVKGRRYDEAIELLYEAQQFDDEQRFFWRLRGYAFLQLKAYDQAEPELLEAQKMGAPDADLLYLLAQVYYNTDRMYEALDALESAEQHDAEHHAVRQMLEKVRREFAVEREMDKEYGGHFVISFEGGNNDELGREVLAALEDAYNWIGSRLDHYPDQRVPVLLYSRRQFTELTDSPEWAGGLYDGKIRLPVGGLAKVDQRMRALLQHEYMHVVVRDLAGKNVPVWLNEGLAEVVERRLSGEPVHLLPMAIAQDKLLPLERLAMPFGSLRGQQVKLAYEQSYDVVRFLIDRYGWYNIRELLFVLRTERTFFDAIEDVLGIYSMTYRTLERRWLEDR